jgi:hypothetical protein
LVKAGFNPEEAEDLIEGTTERLLGYFGGDREEAAEEAGYLLGGVGLTPEEIRLAMLDDDLWRLDPGSRYTYFHDRTAEETVAMWKEAAGKLQALTDIAYGEELFGNPAVGMCLADAAERAREVARRARQRLEEGSEVSNG